MISVTRLDPDRPVIYLDFDGTILVPEHLGFPKKDCIEALNRVIKETNCQIVFSTAHRISRTLSQLAENLERWGVIDCEASGVTGDPSYGIGSRMTEIRRHVHAHGVKNYVAFDDCVTDAEFDALFIQCNCMIGITDEMATRAINFLRTPR